MELTWPRWSRCRHIFQRVPLGQQNHTFHNYHSRKYIYIYITFLVTWLASTLQGLEYIHQSLLRSHGHLRSSCCLVDSRWQIKLTSLGLHFLRIRDRTLLDVEEYQKYRKLLWTAPELLRLSDSQRPACGTKAGDVYSFAILLQEILYRATPYFDVALTPKGALQYTKLLIGHFINSELRGKTHVWFLDVPVQLSYVLKQHIPPL